MKTNILMFLLGICVAMSIAATSNPISRYISQPAMPKMVYAKYIYMLDGDPAQIILNKTKEGYILKSLSFTDHGRGVIVMEKY